jgi:hypothetical protein
MNVRAVTGRGEVSNLCCMDLFIDGFAEPPEAVRAAVVAGAISGMEELSLEPRDGRWEKMA